MAYIVQQLLNAVLVIGGDVYKRQLETITLIFAALQATGVIDWSWQQVLAPMVIKYTIGLAALAALGFLAAAEKFREENNDDKD